MVERAHGIDISQKNTSFSFHQAQKNKSVIQFIILRASLAQRLDDQFLNFLKESASIPIRGAYHYLTYTSDWEDQANAFLKAVEGKGLDFYALDFEKPFEAKKYGLEDYVEKKAAGAGRWLDYVSKNTNKPILFYTNPATYNELKKLGHNWMDQWPLWLANFNVAKPNLPKGVSDWKFWQYSADGNNKGLEYGVKSTHIDLNHYNGTLEQLQDWLESYAKIKSPSVSKLSKPELPYTWRDVIAATKQVDSLRYGAWLKKVGVLSAIKEDRSQLAKPYTGSPIEEWQIKPDKRSEILNELDIVWQYSDVSQQLGTWRDVIQATKQIDSSLYGVWLKKVGVLEMIKQDKSLLTQPYSGPPVIEWQIKLDKRLAILAQLKKSGGMRTKPVKAQKSDLIRLNVPFLSQQDKQEANLHDADCGPTCLAMILRAEGINGSPRAKVVTVNELYQRYLKDILDSKNRKTYTSLGQLKEIGIGEKLDPHYNQYSGRNEALPGLQKRITMGQPFIALINYALWNPKVNLGFRGTHFVVVTGFDENHVYVHDPLFPVERKDEGRFYRWTNHEFLEGWGNVPKSKNGHDLNYVHFWTDKIVSRYQG